MDSDRSALASEGIGCAEANPCAWRKLWGWTSWCDGDGYWIYSDLDRRAGGVGGGVEIGHRAGADRGHGSVLHVDGHSKPRDGERGVGGTDREWDAAG